MQGRPDGEARARGGGVRDQVGFITRINCGLMQGARSRGGRPPAVPVQLLRFITRINCGLMQEYMLLSGVVYYGNVNGWGYFVSLPVLTAG